MKEINLFAILLCWCASISSQSLTEIDPQSLRKRSKVIEVDASYTNGNWDPLLRQIRKKRIVMLGEFTHGAKEVFVTRNDLIKSLHEKLGFDVILFEAGIGEIGVIDSKRSQLSPAQMTGGFFGGWRTKEFRGLMTYVQEENISTAGFDVQRTGNVFANYLANFAKKIKIDTNSYGTIEDEFGQIRADLTNRKTVYSKKMADKTQNLIERYRQLADQIHSRAPQTDQKTSTLTLRTIENRVWYLRYMLDFKIDNDWNKRWKARDSAMAENIQWLMENFYHQQKVIVVAHNFHISLYNQNEEVMGEFLKSKFPGELYALGVFAGGGSYHNNFSKTVAMEPPDTTRTDLKHVIQRLEQPVVFWPIHRKRRRGNDWLNQPIAVNDTFIDLSGTKELVLSKCFDGLLLIDRVTPPE